MAKPPSYRRDFVQTVNRNLKGAEKFNKAPNKLSTPLLRVLGFDAVCLLEFEGCINIRIFRSIVKGSCGDFTGRQRPAVAAHIKAVLALFGDDFRFGTVHRMTTEDGS